MSGKGFGQGIPKVDHTDESIAPLCTGCLLGMSQTSCALCRRCRTAKESVARRWNSSILHQESISKLQQVNSTTTAVSNQTWRVLT